MQPISSIQDAASPYVDWRAAPRPATEVVIFLHDGLGATGSWPTREMIFAVASSAGAFVPMTTVNRTASFLRPAAEADVLAVARIIKPGRTSMDGEVNLPAANPEQPTAHVTRPCMLP